MWVVEGNDASIGFSKSGKPRIYGNGRQEFRREYLDPMGINDLEANWLIVPNNASESWIDSAGDGSFFQKVQAEPDICHFHIDYFKAGGGDQASLGFTLAVPTDLHEKYLSIWKDIICNGSQVRYLMLFHFMGFRRPESLPTFKNPTLAEWQADSILDSKAVYGNDVDVSFHKLDSDSALSGLAK